MKSDSEYLLQELERIEAAIAAITLPEQQIHADLHLDNFLVSPEDGAVTGLLDFEFSSHDWRVMELCVGLSKYVATEGVDIHRLVSLWISGYREAGGRLTKEEVAFAPDGVVLRILSNVTFFAGRAMSDPPQDNIATLASKIVPYAKRCRWIEQNRTWLMEQLTALVD